MPKLKNSNETFLKIFKHYAFDFIIDRSLLIGQKLVETAKIPKIKFFKILFRQCAFIWSHSGLFFGGDFDVNFGSEGRHPVLYHSLLYCGLPHRRMFNELHYVDWRKISHGHGFRPDVNYSQCVPGGSYRSAI